MAKDFISDQEMIMLEKQGKVSYPDFIPDNEAESFFGGEQQKTPTQFSAELPKKPLSQRLGNVLGSILGGKVIGEYLGTKIAERSPEAQKLREVASELADRPLFEAPSGKQIAGDLVSIALNFVPFTKAGQAALATKTIVGQGTKKFVESASKKLAVNAAFGSAGGGAKAAAEDQNILSGAAIGGAIGGIPSAVGSTLKGIFTGKIAQRLQRELTRMGYGASKTQSRFDEVKANKGFETAAKKLQQKYGIGTSAGINQRIRDSLEQSGQQLDAVLSSSKKEFAAVQIKNLITKEIKKEFKGLLSNQEIKSLVNNLPLADLHRKQFINIQELNQLRKRFDSKYLTNSAWMRANPGEKLESYQTAYRVISGAIKKAEPSTKSIFDDRALDMTGLRWLENKITSGGAVNTAGRLLPTIGGFGVGGIPGAIGIEAIRTTLAKTTGAQLLLGLESAMEKLSNNEKAQLATLIAKMGSIRGTIEGL